MDLVSGLPDEVLCHVLSFLPTKHAALTSVLSKRWNNLWTLVPDLDIDDSGTTIHPEEGTGGTDGDIPGFVAFVDRILALQRDSPIKKFSLKCISGVDADCVNRWIRNVLQRGVSHLNLFIDFTYEDLPEEMFFSKTLVELKIRSEHYYWWNSAGRSFLPMLKTLDLDSEMIWLDTEIAKFLPYFPVLEELRLAFTEWYNFNETVSSASLRNLSIHIMCRTTCGLNPEHPKSISFDTPNLLYFNYSDYVAEDYPSVNMKALFDAQINLMLDDDLTEQVRRPNNDLLEDDAVLRYGNVGKLMNGIRHVQQLCFSADTMEVLSLCCDTMPVFNNVRSLIIKSDKDRGWQALPVLLRNCPHLDVLTFEGLLHYVTDKCGDACDCISQEEQGSLLASCPVRRIHIYKFGGTMKEINMIRHLMKSFTCLKEMGVFVEEDDPTEFEVPGKFELVEKILELYDEISSCDVHFLVPAFLRRKWTAQ